MRTTESSEDYLEAILRIRSELGSCHNVDIACLLGYSKASVTKALAGLSTAGLAEVVARDVRLTPEGERIARRTLGRHLIGPRSYQTKAEHANKAVDWQHLFGRFREGRPRLPELDRRHAAQRRVDPEVVVPVHVVREPGPELTRRSERLAAGELGPRYPVDRLVDGAVVGAALGRQRPLYAEGLEHQVDLGVVELAAAVRVEYLDARAAPIWGSGPRWPLWPPLSSVYQRRLF